MNKVLIIAEKPDQAKRYAEVFKTRENHMKDGYIKVSDDSIINGRDIKITFAFGHLLELKKPQEYSSNWEHVTLENLPMFPKNFEYIPIKEKKPQLNKIKRLANDSDTIIVAGDPEREGELIQRLILQYCKINPQNKEIKRFFTNSLEASAVKKAFKNLENDNSDRWNFEYEEASARQHSDWLVGMNLSVLYSNLLKKAGLSYTTISIGRVQTPTLKMVYDRCKEIEDFKPKPFKQLLFKGKKDNLNFDGSLTPSKRFNDENYLKEFLNQSDINLGENEATVSKVESKLKSEQSPRLFNLSSLQQVANSKFNYSAKDTMKAEQYLYDNGFASYPRSDSKYLTEAEFSYLRKSWKKYADFLGINLKNPNLESRSRYVNASKVEEHTAIIPTEKVMSKNEFEKLSDEQKNIYTLILQRTLAMFSENYNFDETTVLFDIGKVQFKTVGKVVRNKGWKSIISNSDDSSKDKDIILPNFKEGDHLSVKIESQNKKTTPPNYFTEGTLIQTMNNAGKQADDTNKKILKEVGGIGTEATRANIIEVLKKRKYVVLEKNKLKITEAGRVVSTAVEQQKLLSKPDLTAKWEFALKEIGSGKRSYSSFLELIQKFIKNVISEAPQQIKTSNDVAKNIASFRKTVDLKEEKKRVGKCPLCGGDIIDKGKNFGCSNYREKGCKFSIYKKIAGKNLTATIIKQLLIDSVSKSKVKGFKKADGTSFDSYIKLVENGNGKIAFDFRS